MFKLSGLASVFLKTKTKVDMHTMMMMQGTASSTRIGQKDNLAAGWHATTKNAAIALATSARYSRTFRLQQQEQHVTRF